jgi:hypothetical protein
MQISSLRTKYIIPQTSDSIVGSIFLQIISDIPNISVPSNAVQKMRSLFYAIEGSNRLIVFTIPGCGLHHAK